MTWGAGTVCLKPEADAMIGGFISGAGMFASNAPPMEVFMAAEKAEPAGLRCQFI